MLYCPQSLGNTVQILLLKSPFLKKQIFSNHPQKDGNTVYKELRQRHIFVIQIYRIAGRQPHLKGIVFGAAGSASHMIHNGAGAISIIVSRNFRPVSHINVFQICKMHFIKISDFLKNLPAVNRRAGAGRKNMAGTFITFNFLTHTSLIGPAHNAVHITAVIHPFSAVHLNHSGAYRKYAGRLFYCLYQFFDIIRFCLCVIV